MGVRKLVSDDKGALGSDFKGVQSASEVSLVLGSASVALVQVLAPLALGAGAQHPSLSLSTLLMSNYLPIPVLGRGVPGHWGKGHRPLWLLPAGQGHRGVLGPSACSLSGCICSGT